ncbi:ERV/ALR sulfhydryl oxidase domain-containing protein [Paraphysoderma sedebokerense]|nr:ERV/ALR sulfhydryl oxidase domain-containing protein [Paraphysoderma sedebokerense]
MPSLSRPLSLLFALTFLFLITTYLYYQSTTDDIRLSKFSSNSNAIEVEPINRLPEWGRIGGPLLSTNKDKNSYQNGNGDLNGGGNGNNNNKDDETDVFNGKVIMKEMGNQTLRKELGRSTWHLLHTMAARFPNVPTDNEQLAMKSYLFLLSRLYPCGDCAHHFSDLLQKYPPDTSSRDSLSQYLCKIHNNVNLRLNHTIFDCNLVGDRWKCGCAEEELEEIEKEERQKEGKKPPSDDKNGNEYGGLEKSREMDEVEKLMRMEKRSMFLEDYLKLLEIKRKEFRETGKVTGVSGVLKLNSTSNGDNSKKSSSSVKLNSSTQNTKEDKIRRER